jgi:hypothetical protein
MTYSENKELSTKTKFFILDCIDLKGSLKFKNDHYDLYRKEDHLNLKKSANKENTSSRRNSIGGQLDLIRRSRFNSRADELKISNATYSQDLINELVNNLGADIQFYQCFKLEDKETAVIVVYNKLLIDLFIKRKYEEMKEKFNLMIKEVSCEKFIAVGQLLDTMFSMNSDNAKYMREYIMYFYDENVIDCEDIKHG